MGDAYYHNIVRQSASYAGTRSRGVTSCRPIAREPSIVLPRESFHRWIRQMRFANILQLSNPFPLSPSHPPSACLPFFLPAHSIRAELAVAVFNFYLPSVCSPEQSSS